MPPEPVSPDPGPSCPDWMDDPAYLAMRAADTDPGDLDLDDPDDDPPPDVDDIRWTTPSGRQYTTEPTPYPI